MKGSLHTEELLTEVVLLVPVEAGNMLAKE
jgi:hypothetical protein